MKIYTKKGDDGSTGLLGGPRVSKDSAQVDVYGEVDHLNSVIGLARAQMLQPKIDEALNVVQHDLFTVGAELASTSAMLSKGIGIRLVSDDDTQRLERIIDAAEAELSALKQFVLPGGTQGAATLHVARTVCRKVERKLVALHHHSALRPEILRYFNRLSDFLFVMARYVNHLAQVPDVPWQGRT